MKKLLSLLLAVLLIMSTVTVVSAETSLPIQSGYYTYTVTNNEATITDVNMSISGDVVIPSHFGEYPVVAIGEEAFSICGNITSVVIPDGVKSIGNDGFYYCDEMVSITLPPSVTSIGSCVFGNCKKLETVNLPQNLKILPSRTFYYCKALKGVQLPSTLEEIGYQAFESCTALESINIPAGVKVIDQEAFEFCNKLTTLVLPNALEEIGSNAFNYCTGITKINIPAKTTSIDYSSFASCDNLREITVSAGNQRYFAANNCLVEGYYGTLIAAPKISDVVIPNGVKYIPAYTFYREPTVLRSVVIPTSVTSIDYGAFANCTSLTTVNYTGTATQWSAINIKEANEALSIVNYNYVPPYKPGDTNGDNFVTLDDVVVLAQKVAGWSVECNVNALNVNGDSAVTLDDVVLLAQYVAGWGGIILH